MRNIITSLCHEQSRKENQDASRPSPSVPDTIITASPCNSGKSTVLLQIWIETPIERVITKCLMDGGSMRSFIREDVSRALKLPVIGEESMNLYTFGSEKPRQVKYNKVKAKLKKYQKWAEYGCRVTGDSSSVHIQNDCCRRSAA